MRATILDVMLAGQATVAMTVAGLVEAYLADPEKAALRSRDEIERRLRRNVVPVIGESEAERTATP